MSTFRALYYADSLGMARPGLLTFKERYIELLRTHLQQNNYEVELFDRSRGGLSLEQLHNWFTQDVNYISEPVDALIIQAGIVDCAPRPVPNRVRNLISKMPDAIRKKIISALHHNRARIFKSGVKFYNTRPDAFYNVVRNWMTRAEKISNCVFIFTIAPTTPNIEMHSPGFSESIIRYNEILKKAVADSGNKNVMVVDVHALISANEAEIEKYVSANDGHHITREGNQLYANALIQCITR